MAEFPLIVLLVSVSVPLLTTPPPTLLFPPVSVRLEIVAETLAPTSITRLALLALIVRPAAGPVMVVAPVVSLRANCIPLRVMVWAVLNTVESKLTVSAPAFKLAWPMAQRKLPLLLSSSEFMTVKVLSNCRSSSPSKNSPRLKNRILRRRTFWVARNRANILRSKAKVRNGMMRNSWVS